MPLTRLPDASMFSRSPLIGGSSGVEPVALMMKSGFSIFTKEGVASVDVKVIRLRSFSAR
ncbi:MAG: hypothetical protein ACLTDX_18785 [[Clostridium] innocuum]